MQRYITSSSIHSIENSDVLRIGDLVRGVWQYRWSAVLLTVFLIPVFGFLVFLIPAKYTSSARLLVRLGRGAVSIDPTANLSQTVSLQESRLAQVNSVKELLGARELSERVVNRIGAERVLEPHGLLETSLDTLVTSVSTVWGTVMPSSPAKPMGELSPEEVESHLELESACLKLEENLHIDSPKDAYTISLDVYSGDPILSRDLLSEKGFARVRVDLRFSRHVSVRFDGIPFVTPQSPSVSLSLDAPSLLNHRDDKVRIRSIPREAFPLLLA